MKSFELKPTEDNLLRTMQENSIGRNGSLFSFVKLLNVLDSNCSISLDGAWGSGKTFFVKQTKMIFDAFNDHYHLEMQSKQSVKSIWNSNNTGETALLEPQVAIYYDAWENDKDDDPILSLIYSIMEQIGESHLISLPKGIVEIAGSIADAVTGRSISGIISSMRAGNAMDWFNRQHDIQSEIDSFFDSILPERGNRLIIFIDELDRCKPDYAVRLLECIKHYFTNEHISFVFSTNITELEHTIKAFYGESFDACKYLDRFFDLRLALEPVDLNKFYSSIHFNDYDTFNIICINISKRMNFQMRETARFFLLTKKAVGRYFIDKRIIYDSSYSGKQFIVFCIIPILIALKIADTKKYNDFVAGNDVSPLLDLLDCYEPYGFNGFLESGETYEVGDSNYNLVTVEEKIKKVYQCIFITEPTREPIRIGSTVFSETAKSDILRIAGLLSSYADFND